MINRPTNDLETNSLIKTLERLVDGGFLNNCRVVVDYHWSRSSRFFRDICSMNNLEKLHLIDCKLSLEQLPQLFQSCPKLIELYFPLTCKKFEMDEEFKNQLRSGFQKIQRLYLVKFTMYRASWPVIQEMLT